MINFRFKRLNYAILLIALSTTVMLQCVSKQNENTELEAKLEQAIRKIENKSMSDSLIIDIAEFAKFEWDKLFTFRDPQSPHKMNKALGIDWEGARTLYEKDNLFVFVKDRKVVAYVFFEGSSYSKKDLIFDGDTWRSSFTPKDAKFVVKKGKASEPYIIKIYPLRYVTNTEMTMEEEPNQ